MGRAAFERLETRFMSQVTLRDAAKCDELGHIYTRCNVQRSPKLQEAALYSLGACIGGISATNPVAFEQENAVIAVQADCSQVEYILTSRHQQNVDRFKTTASALVQRPANGQLARSGNLSASQALGIILCIVFPPILPVCVGNPIPFFFLGKNPRLSLLNFCPTCSHSAMDPPALNL
jgi:hypothetical protein